MHERAAVSGAIASMMAASGGDVTRVVAAIGPGVDRNVVVGIWEEIVADSPAESAELICEVALDTLRCLVCGDDYPGSKLEPCPVCRGAGLVIERAPEFEVRSWVARG